jgi:CRISPR-associated protein Cas1
VSAGYSAGLGFIHTGKLLSFVYDVADLYKADLTMPMAFRLAATGGADLDRKVRMACREAFHKHRLMERILVDIAEVLDAGDDSGEIAGELEGRAVTLADAADGVVFPT